MKPKLIARVLELQGKQNQHKRLSEDEKFIVYLVDRCQELEAENDKLTEKQRSMWRLQTLANALREVLADETIA